MRMRKSSASWTRIFAFALVAALILIPGAQAQSVRGSIEGRVTDESGAAMPGVTITLSSPNLQGTRTEVTENDGSFRFLQLPPGTYAALFEMDMFQSQREEGIVVNIGRKARLDMTLVGAFQDELVVTSERPLVDTSNTELGVNLQADQFKDLPTRRNYTSVARVAPGAQADAAGQTFYGSTGAENSYYIDGVNTTGIELGQQGKVLNFEFIQEVQVKTAGYGAEYGRSTGGLINVITKSGGNEFTGDVFGYADDGGDLKGEAERGPISRATQRKLDARSDFGIDLGGYIAKDKLWFFGAYDRVDNDDIIISLEDFAAFVPGAATKGQQVIDNVERDLWAGKLTFQATAGHSFYASAFGDPSTNVGPGNPEFSLAGPPTHYIATQETGATDYSINWDGVFGRRFIANARYSEHQEELTVTGEGADLVGFLDQTDPLGDGTTTWGWEGAPAPSGFGFFQNQEFGREQINASASYFVDDFGGSHEFKAGYEEEEISVNNANRNSGGSRVYRFPCSASRCLGDNAGADYYYRHRYFVSSKIDPLTATAADVVDPLVVDTKATNDAWYLQDTWRPTGNVTVNAGVRFETQQLYNAFGEVSADIDDNVSPRIGITIDPTKEGKAKIFAHYGRFYETIPMDIVIRSFGGEITVFAYNYSQDPADFAGLPGDQLGRNSTTLGGGVSRVDPGVEGQYLDEFVLGGEMEVGGNWSVGAKYVKRDLKSVIEDALSADGDYFIGNPGRGLMEGTYDIAGAFGYNDVLHQLDEPTRTFEGVEITASKQLTKNFQFLASALWSELKGSYDGTFQASTGQLDPNLNSAFDYFDFSVNNTGFLSNDREWQLKFDGIYNTPVKLVVGASAFYNTGTPVTAMGYSSAYANWEFYLSERGAFGRVDDSYELDLHFGYPIEFGNGAELNLLFDIFNALDAQTETVREIRYTGPDEVYVVLNNDGTPIPPITPGDASRPPTSEGFNTARQWTDPRSFRFGARLSF
jgi:hypothetical protein